LREAGNEGLDFRRREILFAVTAAESYLLEWVRDKVLVGNLHEINRYFPPGSKRGVRDKWKDVPKELASANLIAGVQELSGKTWATFDRLVISATASSTHHPADLKRPVLKTRRFLIRRGRILRRLHEVGR
jgi:hypothetical protein